ncbi:MAG: hypothetical protein VX498_07965 [Myxococcota bacterium]|nr:hypothetical protein [Myxococcota bacterium]
MSYGKNRWGGLFGLVVVMSALVGCQSAPEGADAESPELAGVILEEDALAGQVDSANQIARREGAIHQERAKFVELNKAFEERTGRKLTGVQLTDRQAEILQTMLAKEEDISLKGLLQQILDTKDHIEDLDAQIEDLKSELPTPDVVQRGDTHLGLASDYLMKNHGLSKEDAQRLARRSLLTNNMAPGMEVWHFYADGVYGTTVTQGTARVSPFFLNVREKRKLRRERDDALALAASLEAEIVVLEATRDELTRDLTDMTRKRDVLQVERDDLFVEREELVEADESVYFYVDTRKRLREKDVLPPVGMRVKEWRKDLFTQSIDLRRKKSLRVYAEDFGVRKFHRIQLLPKERYREKTDYQVKYDETKQVATIHLRNVERFKNDAFVVVLK